MSQISGSNYPVANEEVLFWKAKRVPIRPMNRVPAASGECVSLLTRTTGQLAGDDRPDQSNINITVERWSRK